MHMHGTWLLEGVAASRVETDMMSVQVTVDTPKLARVEITTRRKSGKLPLAYKISCIWAINRVGGVGGRGRERITRETPFRYK